MFRDPNGKFCKLNQFHVAGYIFQYINKYIQQFEPTGFDFHEHTLKIPGHVLKFHIHYDSIPFRGNHSKTVMVKFNDSNFIVYPFIELLPTNPIMEIKMEEIKDNIQKVNR